MKGPLLNTIEGTRIGHDDESCCVQEETLFGRLHCTVGIASAGESFASRRPSVRLSVHHRLFLSFWRPLPHSIAIMKLTEWIIVVAATALPITDSIPRSQEWKANRHDNASAVGRVNEETASEMADPGVVGVAVAERLLHFGVVAL